MTDQLPSNILPFVEVLGKDLAIEFLLSFGGSAVFFSERPKDSEMCQLIGIDATTALAHRIGLGPYRIPLAKQWIARQLRAEGLSKSKIARRLRVSDVTVRNYLHEDPAQLPLL
ncbi:hypothetical protein C8J31_102103 [Rhizobium sp. PP-CC-2G-626]|nr:hypothetical protein C8J31_102103 [Rhizobium sp. PP-CC-2G-626]